MARRKKPETIPVDPGLPSVTLPGEMTLNQLFSGDEFAQIRASLIETGVYSFTTKQGHQKTIHAKVQALGNGDYRMLSIAAVSRAPGASFDYVSTLEDYQRKQRNRSTYVDLLWEIYGNHDIINNAIQKQVNLVAAGGEFVIREAKKGKKRDADKLAREILRQWTVRVNAANLMFGKNKQAAGITGSPGLQAMSRHAARVALVEGSWVAQHTWQVVDLGTLGRYELPITLSTISTKYLEPVQEFDETIIERFNWTPPQNLLRQIQSPTNTDYQKEIKKIVPKDYYNQLLRTNKIPLDPALTIHCKYRGRDGVPFGESALQAALPAAAYEQALFRLDLVTMQNLINRFTVIMVGSDDKESPYYKADVQKARAETMRIMMEEPGPNMTIVWAGPDVKVQDIGAHSAVLELENRMKAAADRIKIAMGVPDALLTGSTSSGKAAGWVAVLAMQMCVAEIKDQLQQTWTTLGQHILMENGFTDLVMDYKFKDVAIDQQQDRMLAGQEYARGTRSIRSTIVAQGLDPDLEFVQRCIEKGLDPADPNVTWEQVFTPIAGVPGMGGPGQGRVPKDVIGDPTPDRPSESPGPVENK